MDTSDTGIIVTLKDTPSHLPVVSRWNSAPGKASSRASSAGVIMIRSPPLTGPHQQHLFWVLRCFPRHCIPFVPGTLVYIGHTVKFHIGPNLIIAGESWH